MSLISTENRLLSTPEWQLSTESENTTNTDSFLTSDPLCVNRILLDFNGTSASGLSGVSQALSQDLFLNSACALCHLPTMQLTCDLYESAITKELDNVNRLLQGLDSSKPLQTASPVLATIKPGVTSDRDTANDGNADVASIVSSIFEESVDSDADEPTELKRNRKAVVAADATAAKKRQLLNCVSGSLIGSPNYKDPDDARRQELVRLMQSVEEEDPEFVLKVALYSRRSLNIRTTSNFILAWASLSVHCRSFIERYFGAAVCLPSDWIDVAEYVSTLVERNAKNRFSLPSSLRKAMIAKFSDFDEYQLAKHNKGKKSNKRKKKGGKPGERKKVPDHKKKDAPPATTKDTTNALNLKKLIRQLHVKKPADFVMGIIGKRYPSDSVEFSHSGLLGVWDDSRAGKRMKLKTPQTWETQVSLKGNKAEVWQQLIDDKKLPFMAMLRNLRNMIRSGISTAHHNIVLRRLSDERSVAQSKQFPFRFFSAYEVLSQLRKDMLEKEKRASAAPPPVRASIKQRGQRGKKARGNISREKAKKKQNLIAYDDGLLRRYEKALDTAVKIATDRNVPPIAGRTVVVVSVGDTMNSPCTAAKGMGKPKTSKEVALLLALMCKYACEDCRLILFDGKDKWSEIDRLERGTILENMEKVLEQAETLTTKSNVSQMLRQYSTDRIKIDNLLLIGCSSEGSPEDEMTREFLRRYRILVNSQLLYVNINVSAATGYDIKSSKDGDISELNVYLRGFSDQMLRFVAERGDAGQLTVVDHVDVTYSLPPARLQSPAQTPAALSYRLRAYPSAELLRSLKQRCVRVFVSSTFKDMGVERDLLIRQVFPQIQMRLPAGVRLYPIDLRWGIPTDHDVDYRAFEQCLHEVQRSDIFVGLIGERYGWSPPAEFIDTVSGDSDQFGIAEFRNAGFSITELEARCFMKWNGDSKTAVFFLRSVLAVPQSCTVDTSSPSRVAEFKESIEKWDVSNHQYDKVDVSFAKLVGAKVFETVAGYLDNSTLLPLEETEVSPPCDLMRHWAFIHSSTTSGCPEVMEKLIEKVSKQTKTVTVIESKPQLGKTFFIAQTVQYMRKRTPEVVVPCFSNMFEQDGSNAVLNYLTSVLAFIAGRDCSDSEGSLLFLVDLLADLALRRVQTTLVFDGWDDGCLNTLLDHLTLIKGARLVVTTNENSALHAWTSSLADAARLSLAPLTIADRKQLARTVLAEHSKRVNEKAFDNQLSVLALKRQANLPAYLNLACEFLRQFATFDTLADELRRLPSTMDGLLKELIARISRTDGIGTELVEMFLSIMKLSPIDLTEEDVVRLLTMANVRKKDLDEEMPMYVVASATSLQLLSLCAPLLHQSASSNAFRLRYQIPATGRRPQKQSELLEVLITYALEQCEVLQGNLFVNYAKLLFTSLEKINEPVNRTSRAGFDVLEDMEWTDDYWLKIFSKCFQFNCQSLLFQALEALTTETRTKSLSKMMHKLDDESLIKLKQLKQFLYNSSELLTVYPQLIGQELWNSPLYPKIRKPDCFGYKRYQFVADLLNPLPLCLPVQPLRPSFCYRTVTAGAKLAVTASAVSPDGDWLSLGLSNGSVLLLEYKTASVKSVLDGHNAAVTALCFLGGALLASCSYDGLIHVWNCATRSRIATLREHSSCVSACAAYPSMTGGSASLLSAGWDKCVRLFTPSLVIGGTQKWKQSLALNTHSAVNCVDVHAESGVAVVGCWDTTLKLYNLSLGSRLAVFRGHRSAVRAVSFGADARQIVSAAIDGDVRVWSAVNAVQVGLFHSHTLPITAIGLVANSLICVGEDCFVKAFSDQLGFPLSVESNNEGSVVMPIDLSSDNKWVAIGHSYGSVEVVNRPDNVSTSHPLGVTDPVIAVRFRQIVSLCSIVAITKHSGKILSMDKKSVTELCVGDESAFGAFTCLDVDVSSAVIGSANGLIAVFNLTATLWKKARSIQAVVLDQTIHDGAVRSVALSEDGLKLASVGEDKKLVIWFVGKMLKGDLDAVSVVMDGCHTDWVTCCAWSRNLVVTGSNDCRLKVWDVENVVNVGCYTFNNGPIVDLSTQKGCACFTSTDGYVYVVSVKDGSVITKLRADPTGNDRSPIVGGHLSLRIGGDTTLIAVDGKICWNELVEQEADEKPTTDTQSTLDGALLAVGLSDGGWRTWNPFRGHEQFSDAGGHSGGVLSVATASRASAEFVTTDAAGQCKWWRLPSVDGDWQSMTAERRHTASVLVMTHDDESDRVFSAGRDGSVNVWNDTDGTFLGSTLCHSLAVTAVLFRGETKRLITASEDGFVRLWQVDPNGYSLKLDTELDLHEPVCDMAPLPDLKLDVLRWDGVIHRLDIRGLAVIDASERSFDMRGAIATGLINLEGEDYMSSHQFGRTVMLCHQQQNNDTLRHIYSFHHLLINATCALAVDAETVIVGCTNGDLYEWKYASEPLKLIESAHDGRVNALVHVPDHDVAVLCSVGDDRFVKIWNYRPVPLTTTEVIRETPAINLLGAWLAPTRLTTACFVGGRKDQLWCADTVGTIYRLECGVER